MKGEEEIPGIGPGTPNLKKNIKKDVEGPSDKKTAEKIKESVGNTITSKNDKLAAVKNVKDNGIKGVAEVAASQAIEKASTAALASVGVPPALGQYISKFAGKYGVKLTKKYLKIFFYIFLSTLLILMSILIGLFSSFQKKSNLSAADLINISISTPNIKSGFYIESIAKEFNIDENKFLREMYRGKSVADVILDNSKITKTGDIESRALNAMLIYLDKLKSENTISDTFYGNESKLLKKNIGSIIQQKNSVFAITNAFPPDIWHEAISVASGESGLRPDALNSANNDGSQDIGLYQINTGTDHQTGTMFSAYSSVEDGKCSYEECVQWLYDPYKSALAAEKMWAGCGWDKWAFGKKIPQITHTVHGTENYCDKDFQPNVDARKDIIKNFSNYTIPSGNTKSSMIALTGISFVGVKLGNNQTFNVEGTGTFASFIDRILTKNGASISDIQSIDKNSIPASFKKITDKGDKTGAIVVIRKGNETVVSISLDDSGMYILTPQVISEKGAIVSATSLYNVNPGSITLEYYSI